MTTRNYSSRSQQSTLTSAITAGASTMVVQSGPALLGGATIPAGTTFTLVIDPDTAIEEIVDATAVSTNTFTITRAIDGSSAQSHSAGAVTRHMAIGRDYRESNAHIEASTGVHGISNSSSVVGTIDTQTLTNKTLTSPTITNPSISGAGVDASIVFEGATADAYETTLTVVDPTQDNTLTLPNTTGTIVVATAVQTLTNKTLTSPTISGSPVITGLSSAGMSASSATPKDYVDSILGSATAAATSAASAATSATSAATSATSAAASAVAAASSATASASSATAAATSATSAAASATAAATSATSAAASATASANSASASATSATASASSATASASSASAAATSASSALTSQTAAATSATSAAASATAAATSATSAAASATAAATSATSAAASATEAAGYVVPSQTGNAGKFLGTNGTAVSWGNSATSFIPTGSTVPTNGMYLSGTNTIGFATDSTLRMQMNASGNLSIGAGSSTNRVISMGKSITGNATSYGILNLGAVQSDVTTSAAYYATSGGTQATAFTLGQLNHFYAIQGTLGAGSTVTNQMGYNVDASLIGATNNFGFYGQVPAGTNRWNAYMVGGAANYFNGQTSIGTTVLTLGAGSVDHQLGVLSGSATRIGMVIRGAASQTGDLLQVQNSAGTELFTIDSAGYVGINKATPAYPLDIVGPAGGGALRLTDGVNSTLTIKTESPGNLLTYETGGTAVQRWVLNGAERARIDGSGNVGIGTAAPASFGLLSVATTAAGTPKTVTLLNSRTFTANDGKGVMLAALASNGTIGEHDYGSISFSGNANIGPAGGGATVQFYAGGPSSIKTLSAKYIETNANNGILDLSLWTMGSSRLHITASGDVGIGTTTPTAKLDVNGSINSDNLSSKNGIINSGMDIWQRGTSFALTTPQLAYTADRWMGRHLGTNVTYSQQTSGLTGIQYSLRIQRPNGTTGTNSQQIYYQFETPDSYRYAGKTVTLSFYAKAGANFSSTSSILRSEMYSGTGTNQNIGNGAYTGQVTVASQSNTLTTSWQRFSVTSTVGSTATQIAIIFSATPTGTAGANDWYEIAGAQLEFGSVATPYCSNQPTYQAELAACQRYYYKYASGNNSFLGLGTYYTASAVYLGVYFPVAMRIAPTLDATSGTNYYGISSNNTFDSFNSFTLFRPSTTGAFIFNSSEAAGTIGFSGMAEGTNASGYVAFTSEL